MNYKAEDLTKEEQAAVDALWEQLGHPGVEAWEHNDWVEARKKLIDELRRKLTLDTQYTRATHQYYAMINYKKEGGSAFPQPVNGWIEMSDRKPKDADFPVWNGFFQLGIFWCRTANRPGEIAQCAAYWKPAKNDIPAPPVVELTQEQQDEAALVQYDKMQWPSSEVTPHQRQMWHAALAYERARVKGMQ